MRTYISQAMRDHTFGDQLTELRVEFNQAGASSLDLMLIAIFSGEAAEYYFEVRRALQRAAVDACSHHGWAIPFNQLVIHTQASTDA